MSKRQWAIPAKDWIPTLYAGAIFGGAFWMVLAAKLRFLHSPTDPREHISVLISAGSVTIIGVVIYLIPSRKAKSIGLAIAIGALLGLPVLGYFAIFGD